MQLLILPLGDHAAAAKSLQSCLTLCDPIDSSPPGFPVPGILQARVLEWVAIAFSSETIALGRNIVTEATQLHLHHQNGGISQVLFVSFSGFAAKL